MRLNIRIPDELDSLIDQARRLRHITKSSWACEALRAYLQQNDTFGDLSMVDRKRLDRYAEFLRHCQHERIKRAADTFVAGLLEL